MSKAPAKATKAAPAPRLTALHLLLTIHFDTLGDQPLPRCGGIGLQDCGTSTHVNTIEPLRKGMRYWLEMDQAIRMAQLRGWHVLDTIRGSPAWNTRSRQQDGYGIPGGSGRLIDLQALEDHVYERLWRYNVSSPVVARTAAKPQAIDLLKIGNEIVWDYEPTTEPKPLPVSPTSAVPPPPPWQPDWVAAADMYLAAWRGAKRASLAVRCLTPAWPVGHLASLPEFLEVLAKRAQAQCHMPLAQVIDGVAINAYGHTFDRFCITLGLVRGAMLKVGLPPDFPIDITEAGHQAKYKPSFLELTPEQQGPEWANSILFGVTKGVRSWQTYSWNPRKSAQDAGEVYSLLDNPGWARYLEILWPFVGKTVHYIEPGPGRGHWWRIGGIRRLIG